MIGMFFGLLCLFQPPEGWQAARPQGLSPFIQVGFVGEGKTAYRPSINLAIEETDASLKEYVKAVKGIQTSQPHTRWLDLGSFQTKAALGRLIEIDAETPLGPSKLLQAIVLAEGHAYVLTAACLQEEFNTFRAQILNALHSLSLVPDLFAAVEDTALRERVREKAEAIADPAELEELQNFLAKPEYAHLGSHWQFLVLNEGAKRLYCDRSKRVENAKEAP